MPRVNFDAVEAMETGDFKRPEPGGYVVAIQSMEEGKSAKKGTPYVRMLFDIVEGDFKGYYSDDYAKEHPATHKVDLYYNTPKALAMTKGRLNKISASNHGFDALAAFRADRWDLFFGKRVGLVAGTREYVGNDGEVHTCLDWETFTTPEKVRAGDYRIPGTKHPDGSKDPSYRPGDKPAEEPKQGTPEPVHVPDSSIPF